MATADKDTIYIDIDEEITGIIDKLKNSKSPVVALVLPKRATVFQSIVNMKLLKRAADSSKKNVVLITSEAGLLPLAGAAGVHVAKTLSSVPEIPKQPGMANDEEAVDEATPLEPAEQPVDKTKSVAELAGAGAAVAAAETVHNKKTSPELETVTLNNDDLPPESAKTPNPAASKDKTKKDKSLKVPNFRKFRLAFTITVVVLILAIIGFVVFGGAFAKATIDVSTNSTNVDTNTNLNLSTTAQTVDVGSSTVPAKYASQSKSFSEQVGTTGQKNDGAEATGSVSMTAQACAPNLGQPASVPAGAGVTANGQTYITQDVTTFSPAGSGSGSCINYQAISATDITAQAGGSSYNVSGVPFTVAGRSDITATGSASGGTDNFVQVVNQNDINNAKSKIGSANQDSIKQALESQLEGEGYYPLTVTFTSGTPNVTSSTPVGQPASTVTVTEQITYSMFGVFKSDLTTLIDTQVNSQINTSSQSILDTGLDNANFAVVSLTNTGGQVSMSTVAVAGPQLDVNSIKSESEGKKAGDVKTALSSNPNVTAVSVKFSPFWVSTIPSNPDKISVVIAKPTTTKQASQ